MTEKYKFSQDYELIPPQKQRSYPISTYEWTIIKKKIAEVSDSANLWQTIGSILIGVSLSALTTAIINDFKSEKSLWTCWAIFFVTGISGILSIYFGRTQRKTQNKTKADVLDFMAIIEERFKNSFSNNLQEVDKLILIHSAKYYYDKSFIDVTERIRELIANDTLEFLITNELMGGDPFYGKHKTLEIDCTIDGIRKSISGSEKSTMNIK